MNVLIVDDCKMSQKISRYLLEKHNHEVNTVNNGMEALEHIAIHTPDLILMDIEMPVMNGLEATKHIRANARFKNTPIVAITSHSNFEEQNELFALGMNGHIAKPVNFDQFYEVVGRFLTR